MNDYLETIGRHSIFSDLSENEFQELEDIMDSREFEAGETVFEADQMPRFLYFIEEGRFLLILPSTETKMLNEGQIFGEIGIINSDFRSGKIIAEENSKVISLCGTRLFQPEYVSTETALKITRALGRHITNYLRSKEQVSTLELIRQGEGDTVEFKSSLRWNVHIEKKDKKIENASLKTIAAFLNARGGVLLIGVNDDGECLGLEADKFADHDARLLHLTKIIKDRLGPNAMPSVSMSIERINEKEVLRVDCQPALHPTYFKDGAEEHFYLRTGPSTISLPISKLYLYINERFAGRGK